MAAIVAADLQVQSGVRIRGLSAAVNSDEPQRHAEAGSGGGISDAPSDGSYYSRRNGAWSALAAVAHSGAAADVSGLAAVATSGAYADLSGKPTYLAKRIYHNATATGTVTINWANYDEVRLTLTGDVTLVFSGASDGQGCIVKLKQDGTGGHALTLPSGTRFSADITSYTVTSTAGAIDRIGFLYDGDDSKYDFVSMVRGLA